MLHLVSILIAFMLSVLSSLSVMAGEAVPLPEIEPGTLEAILAFFHSILPASVANPVLSVLLVVGGLRFIFKPFMGGLALFVASTPSTKDDEFLAKVTKSKVYQIVAWLIDLLASVKLPSKKEENKK